MDITLNGKTITYPSGICVKDIIHEQACARDIYAAIFDGKLVDYHYTIQQGGNLSFVYQHQEIGKQIYQRTLNFLFMCAVKKEYPKAHVYIQHSLANGHFCEVVLDGKMITCDVDQIAIHMQTMVQSALPIEKIHRSTTEIADHFEQQGMHYRAGLLRMRTSKTSNMYRLNHEEGYFYGMLLPDTSFLTHFALRPYAHGIWLSTSAWTHDQPKLFNVFQAFEDWGRLIGVSNVAQLNQRIQEGDMNELVLMSETMVEKQLSEMAKQIVKEHPFVRFILVAGPSSAGKTTFSKRLAIHLKIHGKHPIALSMDDFYKNRKDCPRLPDGTYDFDGIHAIDLDVFHTTVHLLQANKTAHIPYFNFKTGEREWHEDRYYTLGKDDIMIIEGIHGLNPAITSFFAKEVRYSVYINALTHLNLDEHNPLPTSDYRLIRRIVRDYQFRGWSAEETIRFWNNVKDGEEKNIYPFQEEADTIFNSSMVYEMSILKKLAVPLLMEVSKQSPQFLEANRLRSLLTFFESGNEDAVPRSSILAEFIGNSIFDVS